LLCESRSFSLLKVFKTTPTKRLRMNRAPKMRKAMKNAINSGCSCLEGT